MSLNHTHYITHRSLSAKAAISLMKLLPSLQPLKSIKSKQSETDLAAGELIIEQKTVESEKFLSVHSSLASTPYSTSPLQSAPVTPPPSPSHAFAVSQREIPPFPSFLSTESESVLKHSISVSSSSKSQATSAATNSDTVLVCRPTSIDFGRFILSAGNKHVPLNSTFSISKVYDGKLSSSPTMHSPFEIAFDCQSLQKLTRSRNHPIAPEITTLFEQQLQYVIINVKQKGDSNSDQTELSTEDTHPTSPFAPTSEPVENSSDILSVYKAQQSPMEFRLSCRVLQAVSFVGHIAINDIETDHITLMPIHFNPRPPAFLEFPDLSQNGNVDMGLCYAEEDGVCKTSSFRVVNIRDFALRVLVSTNLRSQVLLQDLDVPGSVSESNMQFTIAPYAQHSLKIAIKSLMTSDSRESGSIRSLKAGLKFDVFAATEENPDSAPIAQMTISITAQIGRSIIRIRLPPSGNQTGSNFLKQHSQPLLIDFGVSQLSAPSFQVCIAIFVCLFCS
jgi:hypothetical protein